MTKEQKIIKAKVGLSELAKQLGNVSQAWQNARLFAIAFIGSRNSTTKAAIWRCKISRKKPIVANRVAPEIETHVVELALEMRSEESRGRQ